MLKQQFPEQVLLNVSFFLKKCFENLLMVEYAPFHHLEKQWLETQ